MHGSGNLVEVVGDCLEDAQAGLREAIWWLRPSAAAPVAKRLSELYMVTARRSEGEDDRKAVIKLMVERLIELPGDLVLKSIDEYRGVLFPKLDEIRLPIEKSAAYRRRIMVKMAFDDAVKRLRGVLIAPPPRVRCTPEQAAEIRRRYERA